MEGPIFCYIRTESDTKRHPMSPELKALQYLHLAIMSMVAKQFAVLSNLESIQITKKIIPGQLRKSG